MTDRIKKGGLEIAAELHDLVANEIAPGTGVEADHFWTQMETILADLVPVVIEVMMDNPGALWGEASYPVV